MSLISLDARDWHCRADFWAALLPALGAPDWHGPNLDALYDGLVAGENRVRPPLTIEIAVSTPLPEPLTAYLDRVRRVFADAARDTGMTIDFRFI
ncbi:barstar family protein [uncultured Sphingomonas sp.]|uniref:barstar family protein n=1 Tax=uncultured Sphingomonas sp. TaxID=158754 RepID=UPI0030F4E6C3